MNVFKSIIVGVCLLTLIIIAICLAARCVKIKKEGVLQKKDVFICSVFVLFTIICIAIFGDYLNPFDRPLSPVLIAEFEVPEEFELEYPGEKFWHGAYEQYGLYAESFHFNPNERSSIYGFGWPPMDFDRYCYIITYGQKIESLSYNVWETIDYPVRTGAKVGHMVLSDDFSPEKVYVYQIPKIRIDNHVNDPDNPWD